MWFIMVVWVVVLLWVSPAVAVEGLSCQGQLADAQFRISVVDHFRQLTEKELAETLRQKRERELQVDQLTTAKQKLAEELAEAREKLKTFETPK
jgi:hypothetical protein